MARKSKHYPKLKTPSTIASPGMPFACRLPGQLAPGSIIIVEGRVTLEDSLKTKLEELYYRVSGDWASLARERFSVNLMTGRTLDSQDEHDIAFHLNPRFDQGRVIRNTRQDGEWGTEESEPVSMPFRRGQNFSLIITVGEENLKITVDNKAFITYKHRLPLSCITILNIEGCVELHKIEFKNLEPASKSSPPKEPSAPPQPGSRKSSTSSCDWSYGSRPPTPKEIPDLVPVYKPKLPIKLAIPSGLHPGLMVHITAQCPESPHRFLINFERAKTADIPFYFNVRFDEKAVVRNSYIEGCWKEEDRWIPQFPFFAGIEFDIMIRVETEKIMVAVNGHHFAEYKHRVLPLESIDSLKIAGDLIVSSIKFLESDI